VAEVGCATCGASPVGIFRDGSPRYAGACDHPPLRADEAHASFTPYAPPFAVVHLSDEEVAMAHARAESIVATDSERGWRMKFNPRGESRLQVNERGFAAELAASRATGLKLNWTKLGKGYRSRDKLPDIGERVEVRNARRGNGRLVAHPGERKDWAYLLVTGEGRTFVVVGWMEGRALIVPARWEEPPKVQYNGYFAAQHDLHPLPLPADA
jgi:hypothetical protein